MTRIRYLWHYLYMRVQPYSTHTGAKQYASNMARARRRARIEKWGRV